MTYNMNVIKDMVRRNPGIEIIYFWGHTPNPRKMTKACFSQWYDCRFKVGDVDYHTTEQYMMASKALLFGDEETYREIMEAEGPDRYKKLGRRVCNFDPDVWDDRKYDIVVEGNKAKFSQNLELMEFLLSTGDAILVEASPYDKIWGIGLDIETAKEGSVEDWKGENLLGCALMETRDWLRENNNY